MRAFVRAAFAAALVLLLSAPTIAADKSFKRDDLADAATKLEAQIKAESGQVTKPIAGARSTPPSSAATTAAAHGSSGRSSPSRPTVV